MIEELVEAVPAFLAWRALFPDTIESVTVIERYYRALLAERMQMLGYPGTLRLVDLQAKRTVTHAMALVAAHHLSMPIIPLAQHWHYPREHLYRAARDVASVFGVPWQTIAVPLAGEGLWPYHSGVVIEVIGHRDAENFLAMCLPIPFEEIAYDDETCLVLGRYRGSRPCVQVAINTVPTREDALTVSYDQGTFLCGTARLSPLDVLQRCHELALIQREKYQALSDVA